MNPGRALLGLSILCLGCEVELPPACEDGATVTCYARSSTDFLCRKGTRSCEGGALVTECAGTEVADPAYCDEPASSGGGGGAGGAAPTTLTIKASTSDDGFLRSGDEAAGCGLTPYDSVTIDTVAVVAVGREIACSMPATDRAFFRFDLTPLASKSVAGARLRLHLYATTAKAGAVLDEIADHGALDAGDFWARPIASLGRVIDPTTMPGQWVEVDIGARITAALAASQSAIAFRLSYEDETADPLDEADLYSIVASESPDDLGPQIVVTYAP